MGFEPLFEDGRTFEDGRVSVVSAGQIRLQSGRVIVGDPSSTAKPLVRAVPAGTYPVQLSIGHTTDGDTRVAAAQIVFADRPVASWEPALPEGDDPRDLEPGEFFGYGVDAGTACFADSEAALDFGRFESQIVDPLVADPLTPVNLGDLVAFSSGAGDGFYTSFWGLDADGLPVRLVTEFRILGLDETAGLAILHAHWPGTPPPDADLDAYFTPELAARVDTHTIRTVSTLLCGAPRQPLVFERRIPAGTHAVKVAWARDRAGERPVAVRVTFADRPVAQWELAIPRGADLAASTGLSFCCEDQQPFVIADGSAKTAISRAVSKVVAAIGEGSRKVPIVTAFEFADRPMLGIHGRGANGYAFFGLDVEGEPVCFVAVLDVMVGKDVARPFDVIEHSKKRARS